MNAPLRVAIVAGEESGDLLGADLVTALTALSGRNVELVGVGGRHLQALGLKSLFDSSDIALMGITAIIKDLPRLIRRIGQTASAIVREKPDCVITIDSPDFSLRVAKKIRAADPSIPILHYVCPSVWAWRPSRAPAMRTYVDRILCVLPFEPDALQKLDGPPGTYVGHRLTSHPDVASAAATQIARNATERASPRQLLVLPGSRTNEVKRLIAPFGNVIKLLAERGHVFEVTIPTVPHVAALVEQSTRDWPVQPRILQDQSEKWAAFAKADAALAASGTVLLELALCNVPMISCYKTDPVIGPLIRRLVTVWAASLPNIIADWPVVNEFYDEFVKPPHLARLLEQLMGDTPLRASQLAGFADIATRMHTSRPAGDLAAQAVLAEIASHR